jgi:hypothetical protein
MILVKTWCGGFWLGAALTLCAPAGAWAAGAAPDPRLAGCAEIAEDLARLRCYDGLARPHPSPSAIQTLPVDAPAPPAPRPRAAPVGLRLDGGWGASVGDYVGTLSLPSHGALKIDSQTGGAGGGVLAEAWLDGWPSRDLSIGMEYIRIDNRGALDLALPAGLSILTDPVDANLSLRVAADVGMLNLAYRPRGFGWLRPVIGVGVGGGSGYASYSYLLSNAFLGQALGGSRSRSPFPMVQAFAGVDAELPRHVYLSLTGRLMTVNGHPIGLNQSYTDLVIGTTLGYKFR